MTNGDMCNCACYCFGVENVIHWYDGIFVLGDNDNELVTVTLPEDHQIRQLREAII